jgi:hypothetical protein
MGRQREFCRTWPNQTEVTVKGIHFAQEDSPIEIGAGRRHFRADPSPPIAGQTEWLTDTPATADVQERIAAFPKQPPQFNGR